MPRAGMPTVVSRTWQVIGGRAGLAAGGAATPSLGAGAAMAGERWWVRALRRAEMGGGGGMRVPERSAQRECDVGRAAGTRKGLWMAVEGQLGWVVGEIYMVCWSCLTVEL
jgi:hypothetical protein